MKIWEEEFLNIRNFIFFILYYSWAYNFAFSEFYSWKKLHEGINVQSYFEKGNKYISTYKSQCFKEAYDIMLRHTHCNGGPNAARGSRAGQPCSNSFILMTSWDFSSLPDLFFLATYFLRTVIQSLDCIHHYHLNQNQNGEDTVVCEKITRGYHLRSEMDGLFLIIY